MGLLKGVGIVVAGLVLAVPAAIALAALGLPILMIGAAIAAVFAVGGLLVALPGLIAGAVVVALIGAAVGILFGLVGLAVRLALPIGLIALAVMMLRSTRRHRDADRRRVAALSAPVVVRDRYQEEAERELDRELGL
jgi:hypothetical protein